MADSHKSEQAQDRPAETVAPVKAPDRQPAAAKEPDNQVAVEVNPDYEFDGDTVTVEVGSFEPVKLSKGETVKVDTEHARVLVSSGFVRVAE